MNKPFPAVKDEESDLVARIRGSDEGAFETLYLAHHDELWRFAYSYVRSLDVAEELVQDVFLAVWGTRATWEVNTRVRAWLYASVRHLALNHLRHERVVARTIGAGAWAGNHGSGAGERTSGIPQREAIAMGTAPVDQQLTLEAEELAKAVGRAIPDLPERRRIAMTLRWKHDMSSLEIARVLGTTPEAVRTLLTRARADLASLLERAGH
ncbi:MAG: sigma-70 family RNA polymerase sigma factor [Gemmatimonadota bacterium]|nr:sigma-70 family RNA polymerase sigma factor [Gemmatimonadota bacterium]